MVAASFNAARRDAHEDIIDLRGRRVALPEIPTARSTRPRSRTTASLRSTRTGLLHGRRIALHPSLLRPCAVALVNLPGRCLGPSGDGLASILIVSAFVAVTMDGRSTACPRASSAVDGGARCPR